MFEDGDGDYESEDYVDGMVDTRQRCTACASLLYKDCVGNYRCENCDLPCHYCTDQ